ncbi:MAG TPA: FHA domain-containing protein [Gemmatimonadaceae bacterium]|nr:FHA domain-containing protein [Gemmatimonadaceae bacterium]
MLEAVVFVALPRLTDGVVVAMLLIAAAAAAGVVIVRWWSDRRMSTRPLPPLVFPFTPTPPRGVGERVPPTTATTAPTAATAATAATSTPAAPRPIQRVEHTARPDAPALADVQLRVERPVRVETPVRPNGPDRVKRTVRDLDLVPIEYLAPDDERRVLDDRDEHRPAPDETVRFRRPVEEPVQLLPGRLEVLAGESQHHEIRFVRIPGEPMQLIVGRDAGPSAQYVALKSSTVSRRHARFAFANGQWAVKNLSQTNPVVVNDEQLSHTDDERALVDGDRLELGEVVLRFRAH